MLSQTGKLRNFPMVFIGVDYWRPLFDYMRDTLAVGGAIDAADWQRLVITDDIEAAAKSIRDTAVGEFGLRESGKQKKRWWLAER